MHSENEKTIKAVKISNHNVPKTFKEAQSTIVPVVMNRWVLDIEERLRSERGFNIVTRSVTEDLTAVLSYDLPHGIGPVDASTLAAWGASETQAFELAYANAHARQLDDSKVGRSWPIEEFAAKYGLTTDRVSDMIVSPVLRDCVRQTDGRSHIAEVNASLRFCPLELYPRVHLAVGSGEALSPRIFASGWIRSVPVAGDPIVMIQRQDVVLVTGSEDSEGLIQMAAVAGTVPVVPHHVSNIPIRQTENGWVPYEPPLGHPARHAFERLKCDERSGLYEFQRQLHDSEGIYAYCATVTQDYRAFNTLCTWTSKADWLLPKTDLVAFMHSATSTAPARGAVPALPWKDVQTIVGHRMERLDCSPVRYRVHGFPSNVELQGLSRASQRVACTCDCRPQIICSN